MKKLFWIIAGLLIAIPLDAQTWKTKLVREGDNPVTKTLRIKSGNTVSIGTLLPEENSVKGNRYFYGSFLNGTADSIKISLKDVKVTMFKPGGITETTSTPSKAFLARPIPEDNTYSLALADIDFLKYERSRVKYMETFELGLLTSLAVLLVSPFICINYNDMTFNADRYKYWALGSTIGIAASITWAIATGSGSHSLQFTSGWPNKKAKVWKFK
jgi:hypothetical protein